MYMRSLTRPGILRRLISSAEDYSSYLKSFVGGNDRTFRDRTAFIYKISSVRSLNQEYDRALAVHSKDMMRVLSEDLGAYLSSINDDELEKFLDLYGQLLSQAELNSRLKAIDKLKEEITRLSTSDPSAFLRILKWTTEYILIKDPEIKPMLNILTNCAAHMVNQDRCSSLDERAVLVSYISMLGAQNRVKTDIKLNFFNAYKDVS